MSDQERIVHIKNEQATEEFGLNLASELKPGDIVALIGALGTGKTALTKYIAKGLGVTENIDSPTFNIVKEYKSGRLPLFHFDVYRLSGGDDLLDIGADEYFYSNGVCVVEWADLVADVIPDKAKVIIIKYGENQGERIYRCIF
ncbi:MULTISPECIES: tRNA (adenosine(37)-N6)-threonylcarbamoyltransferase complex ATPase subunit type 1 TsaE [Mogibacterium]|jgi:hydrolase, P-loop family|uniref:tRNA threonylcarbamoyladenosine biosynthesis protein TsaE n=3 Tax=Mogibacterium timidum TaxID=35519 RepID=X8ISF6_9FIRM|nr:MULTISPECIES: tRNA (adenosine(37)-N6)-threonylcarbamoyltransferase complex ATPase subunit type 1 TsaE [Mogibacterium]EJU20282.1 tRNA threonylcarbamoyl adenosine modification protein YjeE [Mogibacterium sp. CM50]EUC52572.1 tRNA threonylcarbamoyl adenosine modification protein YjeE [Mogibacterium timidum ATCC 33093]NWO23275.1 tRNA (adenosine(37)-N6)-threonylcarbamoyltransferase complex ATPase subunit type 1 TsaE [Mogibacterium timidum]